MEKMRAARIVGPRHVEIERVPILEPGPSEVRVQLSGCGVCGSNLASWCGRPWFEYPLEPGAPGHEAWGYVDQVGTGVDSFRRGDRVALLSYHSFAEYDIAEAGRLVSAPEGATVFPAEALGCAINVFRRSSIEAGQTVAVIGIGFIGALLVQLAAGAAAQVIAISRRHFALEIARGCGAVHTVRMTDTNTTVAEVLSLTGGSGCARVIEATGEQEALDLAGEVIALRGRLVIAGFHQDSCRYVNMQLWNWRGIDVVNAHERDPGTYVNGMRAAADEIRRGNLDPSPLYTNSFSLEELSEAFNMMEQRPDGFLKAWIRL